MRHVLEILEFRAARGRDAIFEHPLGALSWNGLPELRRFMNKYHEGTIHGCAYGQKAADVN